MIIHSEAITWVVIADYVTFFGHKRGQPGDGSKNKFAA